ncbi:MAG TPA: DUF4397 domain-containing protein [Candidatus Kapabacteria bacterium]|nr:DUF4397 domain-containing protein [Candidatus Kapabacteria bacterium]
MVRSLFLLVAVALAAALGACTPEDPFVPTFHVDTTIKHPAYLRIVHAAADAPVAGAVIDGKPFLGPLPYLDFRSGINEAKYYPADTAWHSIGFLGGGRMLSTGSLAMVEGAFYTAYLHGRDGDYRILVTRDTVEPPAAVDNFRIRVVNLAPDAPPLDLRMTTSPDDPVAVGVAYGSASAYSTRGAVDMERPGLTVTRSGTQDTLMSFPDGLMLLLGKTTLTLVISGYVLPSGSDPMLSFAAFVESTRDPVTGLYGNLPFRLSLVGIRLINLVQLPKDSTLDLSFYDADFEKKFPGQNDGFRRFYPGQDSVKRVPSLIYPEVRPMGYFLQSATKPVWRYRVERVSRPRVDNEDQVPISREDTLTTAINQRYTVVVFGRDTNFQVRTAELNDDVIAPSGSMARLRFFHGGFGSLTESRLRLRVAAAESGLQSYGTAPTKEMAFDAAAGPVTLEVVDESGTVVATASATLRGGTAYTVFLAPLGTGPGWIIRPVADGFAR